MKKIIPITELRNTNEISNLCRNANYPIFVTKHGHEDIVIMSSSHYYSQDRNNTNVENEHQNVHYNDIKMEVQDKCLGLIKVCAANFETKINHISYNEEQIINTISASYKQGAKIIVLPELCLTSYSCGDLFLSSDLLNNVIESIKRISKKTKNIDAFYTFGAPIVFENKIYNCAICMHQGDILGIVPKSYIPEYNEFYEKRYFQNYTSSKIKTYYLDDLAIPFGPNLLFQNTRYQDQIIGVEICEDMWVNIPRSSILSDLGATIVVNLSASNETLHKEETRRNLIKSSCARSNIAYIYASSSSSESTSDVIFSGHNIICEPDGIISESSLFDHYQLISEIDLTKIVSLRRQKNYQSSLQIEKRIIPFSSKLEIPTLTRKIKRLPFVNEDKNESLIEVRKILTMQAKSLIKRLTTINCKNVVIGISGGLDSTISLLATVKAFDLMKLPRSNIHALTMPCFGTTKRTKSNAEILCNKLNVTLKTIDISQSVTQHLKDIDVSLDDRSVTYENAQARERTQILMDYTNKVNGIVIGTGDLSEIALGWSTYNGDHMSMYNLNCSLPKTLIKEMCFQLTNDYPEVKDILLDILDTPVSPELLPPSKDQISQLTEDAVGPYELHDFFLYHFIYQHLELEKVYLYAKKAFEGIYQKETIKKWLKHFVKRFFNNQFKRSCCPDGPKITEVSLSPRGDFRMPSDVNGYDLINQIDTFD